MPDVTTFKPRPIGLRSPDARRLKVGPLNATKRSLAFLRKADPPWTVDVAEKFITHGGTKAQQEYIDALLRQRGELIRRLRMVHRKGYPGSRCDVDMTEAGLNHFLSRLQEPKPPAGIGGYRKDLFGFIDILAFRGPETLAVQTTSFKEVATHLREFGRDEELRQTILDWIGWPDRDLVLHGWRAMEVPKKDGKGTKAEWQVTERVVKVDDFAEEDF